MICGCRLHSCSTPTPKLEEENERLRKEVSELEEKLHALRCIVAGCNPCYGKFTTWGRTR